MSSIVSPSTTRATKYVRGFAGRLEGFGCEVRDGAGASEVADVALWDGEGDREGGELGFASRVALGVPAPTRLAIAPAPHRRTMRPTTVPKTISTVAFVLLRPDWRS